MDNNQQDMTDQQLDILLQAADPASLQSDVDDRIVTLADGWHQTNRKLRRRRRAVKIGVLAAAAGVFFIIYPAIVGSDRVAESLEQSPSTANSENAKPHELESPQAVLPSSQGSGSLDSDASSRETLAKTKSPESETSLPLWQQFRGALASSQPKSKHDWRRLVRQVQMLSMAEQRELMFGVGKIEDPELRERGGRVILDASGAQAKLVLQHWCRLKEMRTFAWQQLVNHATLAELETLPRYANTSAERQAICERLAETWNVGGVEALVRLASESDWRGPVQRASAKLPLACVARLLTTIDRDASQRASAGFVLMAMPKHDVDDALVKMIVQGKRRLPAYQALLVRDTVKARRFLMLSSQRDDLSPALAAAWQRWIKWGPQTSKWVNEIRRFENESDKANMHVPLGSDRWVVVLPCYVELRRG